MSEENIKKWFADKYDMGIHGQRMFTIEFNANHVCQFIRKYLIDMGSVFPENELEEKEFDKSHKAAIHQLTGKEINPIKLLKDIKEEEKLQWLMASDDNIHDAYFAETEKENCICINIGSITKQFEVCFTEGQLQKMLSLCEDN